MKTSPYVLSAFPPGPAGSLDLEACDDLEGLAKRLIDGRHPGVFTTVDDEGCPHTRWMATLAFDDFPEIYALTAPNSRKLAHIAKHPVVQWMFCNQDLTLVLNFTGRAQVVSDMSAIQRIWRLIENKSHAFFLNNLGKTSGVAVLQTTVDHIECSLPQSNLRCSMDPVSLARVRAGIQRPSRVLSEL